MIINTIHFSGIKGSYTKNNRNYNINYNNKNITMEIDKDSKGLNTLKVSKPNNKEHFSTKNYYNIQRINLDKIDEESGVVIKSNDKFHIKEVAGSGDGAFLEVQNNSSISVDKMSNTELFLDPSRNQFLSIKNGQNIDIHNMQTDKILSLKSAKNLNIKSDTLLEKLNIKAENSTIGTNENLDLFM